MKACGYTVLLAYLATVYLGASIYYMVSTQSLGTPFKDSLTYEQKEIMKNSSKKRKMVFMNGVGLTMLILVFTRPFSKC